MINAVSGINNKNVKMDHDAVALCMLYSVSHNVWPVQQDKIYYIKLIIITECTVWLMLQVRCWVYGSFIYIQYAMKYRMQRHCL